jgi:DNA modification methylase
MRRALTNVGGPVEVLGGNEAERSTLEHALNTRGEEGTRDHVHGFHSYPARLHPITARGLVEGLSRPGDLLLDPLCGSGTVLVEALLAGRGAIGIDANPLAIELSWLKTRRFDERERAEILAGAEKVAAEAERRRKAKAGATRRYGREDVALFEPHILLELDGLASGLQSIGTGARVKAGASDARRALALVLSSILVKVSRRPGDTSADQRARRLSGGFTIKLFVRKTEELAERLAGFAALLPPDARDPANVRWGDARVISGVRDASVDLIVTSPPYPANYDYLAQHALRLRWLGLDAERFAEMELGARRHLQPLREADARRRWESELGAALSAMGRVVAPTGRVVLILADTVVGHHALYADDMVRAIAPRAGLVVTAVASQARPHFHKATAHAFDRRPRREHAIVCRPRRRMFDQGRDRNA